MLLPMDIDPSLLSPDRIRPLSRAEYDRMVELGFFDEDEHVELLEGVLVQMSPQGGPHAGVIEWLSDLLTRSLDTSLVVRTQMPIVAGDYSEPEPDIAVVRRAAKIRRDHPSEAFLVVEVTNEPDRKAQAAKVGIYAKATVPEYWIIDLENRCIEVYTKPSRGRYTRTEVLRAGDTLRPTQLAGIEIAVADVVG
jgi:Uma2 family endonuclease